MAEAKTVHILEGGRSHCGIPSAPKEWPPGHYWIAYNDPDASRANCDWCLDPMRGISPVARSVMLDLMARASSELYARAFSIGCHPFIEFVGLINEYLKVCQLAHASGFDFTQASAHSGKGLPMAPYNAAYIGEKLGCIYGPSLQSPENLAAFMRAAGLGK